MKIEVKEDCVFVVFHGPCLDQQGHLPLYKKNGGKAPLGRTIIIYIIFERQKGRRQGIVFVLGTL